LLISMETEAEAEGIPIVGPVVGELLSLLAGISGARRMLELGAATGYSAIYLARGAAAVSGEVISLENDPAMARRARENAEKAGLSERITIREGDALTEMAAMEPAPFDLIFMDIDKAVYRPALPHCERLLRPGGLLFVDNVGFAGADDFNRALWESDRWQVVNLLALLPLHSPERDGLAFAVRR
jgi:predicted O-methyltransferase YrrM